MFSFRKNGKKDGDAKHYFVGVYISSSARKLEAALISSDGSHPGAALTLEKSASFDLPEEIASAYEKIVESVRDEHDAEILKSKVNGEKKDDFEQFFSKSSTAKRESERSSTDGSLVKLASLRAMTTSIQEEAISVLLEEANLKPNDVVAVAVNDPGVWVSPSEWSQKETWYSISSGKLLARRTGMNVIDSFVPADWSPKGYGRAFLALPYWILLSSKEKARLVLDVGETARWTYLPAAKSKDSWSQTYYREVAPCGSILNFFTRQATKGATLVDLGGKLSVQGRSPNELLDFWRDAQQKARCIDDLPQRYYTTSLSGTFNELFYFDTLKLTPPRKFSTLDALCGAVYWIAEEIKASLDSYHFSEPYEIVLTGATRQNGLLFSRLSTLIKQNAFHRLSEYGFIEDSFDGAAAATLGILFAANIPAAWPELHGVKSPALLGRASFGTLESSRRLLHFANRK